MSSETENNDLKLAWKLHTGSDLPVISDRRAIDAGAQVWHVEAIKAPPFLGMTFQGCEIGSGSAAAAVWWAKHSEPVSLANFLAAVPSLERSSRSLAMQMLAVKDAEIVIASYNLDQAPRIPTDADGLEDLARLISTGMLDSRQEQWMGLHFRGTLGLDLKAAGLNLGEAGIFIEKIFPAPAKLKGTLRTDGEFASLLVECTPATAESFSMRPGSDWNLTIHGVEIGATLYKETGDLDTVRAKATLTLVGHDIGVEALVDLAQGKVALDVQPNWTVDLGWLKKIGGEEEFAKGAGNALEGKSAAGEESGFAGASFAVTRITTELAWKPKMAARALSVTLGNPQMDGKPLKWRLLGGELEATLTGYWSKPEGGESSFDCSVAGTWTWDAVRFAASLDTRSGDFNAQLNFGDQKDALDAFTRKKLFPDTKPSKETGKKPAPPGGLPPAAEIKLNATEKAGKDAAQREAALAKKKREIAEIKAKLERPFEIVYFDVSGNYRHKTIEAQLETAGYLGFRLRGNDDDPYRVDVRIGDLLCAGSYDQSGENAAWSLRVAGTIALLGGGEPKALGEGARVEGKFGSAGTELGLKIKRFDIGELVGLVLADAPPEGLEGIALEEVEILYKTSKTATSFSLKCKSDIPLFGPASLKGLELNVASAAKKDPPDPDAPKPVNSGSAKIGFGKSLVIDLKVEFKEHAINFKGSAKQIDVSELIEGFFQKDAFVSEKLPPSPSKPGDKDPNRIIARKVEVEFSLARGKSSKNPTPTQPPNGQGVTSPMEGNALVVTVELERGESSLKLLLVAEGIAKQDGDDGIEWRILFAGDLEVKAKGLPLIGDILGDKADEFGVELHALYVKTKEDAGGKADTDIAKKLFKHSETISSVWIKDKEPIELKEGFDVKAAIRTLPLAATTTKPALPAPASGTGSGGSQVPAKTDGDVPPTGKGLTWKDTDLRVGPVQLSRVGYGTREIPAAGKEPQKHVGIVALDAALDIGVLRLAVVGLGLEVEIPSFKVTPQLEGLALNVRNGPVEITGALVHRNGVFAGLAQIKTANMTLGATGRFSLQGSRPSFFIYCVYASTLGGPPAFFVEGLAGGMGYDTRLVLPKVEDVPKFALVKAAKEGLGGSPEQQIAAFDACIVSAPHNLWFAAGVRFSTFKILNSVVVVALSISPDDVEVDIFGVMSLRMPPQPDGAGKKLITIASADLAIRGKISTKNGEIWLRGQIMPGAFIFDQDCRIVGGFAFQMWFSGPHKGDFVATIGGYHPAFKKPDHYFDVPRFGIEWQLTKELSIKGGAYLAVTSRALMAGGRLEILYQSGSVRACFVAEAHFLAEWAPLRYMADVRISVDASFTLSVWGWSKEFNVHVAAQLHLEGPPFSGFAKIELGPIDITIRFGEAAPAPALSWEDFAKNFLPERKAVIALRGTGLNKEAPAKKAEPPVPAAPPEIVTTHWVLVPGQAWELSIETCIPATSFLIGGEHLIAVSSDRSGIAFHAVPALALDSVHGVMNKFHAVPTRREVKSEMTITALGSDANPWISAVEALGMDTRNHEPIVTPAAPALWAKEPPSSKTPVSPDQDPRLNPTLEKAERCVFGVTLRGKPPKFKMDTADCKVAPPKKPRALQVPAGAARSWERYEDDPFSNEGAAAYVRLPRAMETTESRTA